MKAFPLALLLVALTAAPAGAASVLRVDASKAGPQTSAFITGAGQAFSTSAGAPPSNWDDAANRPDAAVVDQTTAAGVRLIRFPGGSEAGRYDWEAGLGPIRAPCQSSGRGVKARPLSNVYGFDEHMRFAEAAGAQAEVMVPFAFSSAQAAADWVEYANAPLDGSNPGGGIDWAAVRALDGHPAPYDVTRWEIGNEPDRNGQRYWMSTNADTARAQYANGGVHRAFNESADADCRWATKTSGVSGQVFHTRYRPVRPKGFQLTVGDVVWNRVPDLSAAAPDADVYTLDEITGTIHFGDNVRGRIPPGGARVGVSYRTPRLPGYDDFRTAMKAVDPTIDVCATWADVPFLRAAVRDGREIDCVTAHPNTSLAEYGGVLYNPAAYDAGMKGAGRASRQIARLAAAARKAPGRPYVAISDYGAVAGGAQLEAGAAASMIHAMYMATEQLTWLRLGLPWATGGRLTDFATAIVNASGAGLTPAGTALLPFDGLPGAQLVRARIEANPRRHGYSSLRAVAARGENGRLILLILNRDRERPVAVRLALKGFAASGQAEQAQTTSAAFDSALASYESRPVAAKDGTVLRLPAHSFTRLTLDP
ncbi:MAG: alpha-L-arabinofuranosidase [Solirubrobacteraceae bacterium]|nr:alpha-L-arabinofuranosidase [Solirubrobacteraceae bacterium]